MNHAALLLLSLAGFACLSLSMTRHQKEWLGRVLPRARARPLRWAGFLLIAAGLPIAIAALGRSFGPVAWFGHMSLAAATVFLTLLWRRRRMEIRSGALRRPPRSA